MVYAPEEKLKMDRLMEIFADYVAASDEIDIAYTDKTGFVQLVIAENSDYFFFPIQGYDDMLQLFFYHILCDEVELALKRDPDLRNQTMDYSIPYERLRAILDTMDEDRDYAMDKLEKFIDHWKHHPYLP